MPDFTIKVDEEKGIAYIPKFLREDLGIEIKGIPNSKTAVIFPEGMDLKYVSESLKIILQNIELRREMEKEEEGAD